jgi:hypothetical protein
VAIPTPGSSAVYPCSPVPVFFPMALPTEPVGFFEGHRSPAGQVENIPVFGIMAVEAPTIFLIVLKSNFGVKTGELPSSAVHRDHVVAVGTGENARGERRGGDLEALLGFRYRRLVTDMCQGAIFSRGLSAPERQQEGCQAHRDSGVGEGGTSLASGPLKSWFWPHYSPRWIRMSRKTCQFLAADLPHTTGWPGAGVKSSLIFPPEG